MKIKIFLPVIISGTLGVLLNVILYDHKDVLVSLLSLFWAIGFVGGALTILFIASEER